MATAPIGVAIGQIHRLFLEGTVTGLSDAGLLERFVEHRDEYAFAALVERHGPMVLGTCRAILKDSHFAEDAFQATFLVLAQKAHSIRGQEALGGWLHRVAYRIAIQANTAAIRRRSVERRAGELADPRESFSQVSDELRTVLHTELERLPEKYRLSVILCDLQGLTRQQAALQLSWTEWKVRRRLERGRELLRGQLMRRGFALTSGLVVAGLAKEASAAVPEGWTAASVRLAGAFAARAGARGLASATTLALAEGVMQSASFVQWKFAVVAVLTGVAMWRVLTAMAPAATGDEIQKAGIDRPQRAGRVPSALALREAPGAEAGKTTAADLITIQGRVIDPKGQPVAGAALGYYGSWAPSNKAAGKTRAVTDSDGRFHFTVPRAETNEFWKELPVVATAEGYGPDWTNLSSAGADGQLTLRLVPDDVPLEGRVLDLQGHPVVGASVQVQRLEVPQQENLDTYLLAWKNAQGDLEGTIARTLFNTDLAGLSDAVRTNSEGRFKIRGIGRERIARLSVSNPSIEQTEIRGLTRNGLDQKTLNAVDSETQLTNNQVLRQGPQPYGSRFDLLVGPGRSISGTVRDSKGKPLSGARVSGGAEGEGHRQNLETTTDAQGRYHMEGLGVAAKVRINVFGVPGTRELPASKTSSPQDGVSSSVLDFTLEHGMSVKGKVVNHETGQPVGGRNVLVLYRPKPGNVFYTNTPLGEWMNHVVSAEPVKEDGTFEAVAGPGPGVLLVQLQGSLETRYLNSRRSPKPKTTDAASKNAGDPDRPLPFFSYGIPYHSYVSIEPKPDSQELACEIRLEPSREKTGKVTGPDGQPLSGATISGLSDPFDRPRELKTDSFTIETLAPERSRYIWANHAQKKLAGVLSVSSATQDPVTLALEPWGIATGRVVDSDGQPLSGIQINAAYRDGKNDIVIRDYGQPSNARTLSDDEGRFRLEGLIPGLKTELLFQRKGSSFVGTGQLEGFSLKPGETHDVGEIAVKPYP